MVMSPQQPSKECLVDGHLKCVEKRELTKRGVQFSHIKLRRAGGHTVKFTLPAEHAAGVEIGGFYKIAILPDRAPEAPELPKLNPGDRVLVWSKRADLKVWRPAVVICVTPGDRAIIRDWARSGLKRKVNASRLTIAPDPFPSLDDFAAILPGDAVLWEGKRAAVSNFVSRDQVVVTYHGRPAFQSSSKIVPLSQLVRVGTLESRPPAPSSRDL
jgi:hypothetical protein